MALFKKKADPISDRAKALTSEIAALESQIRKLDTQLQSQPSGNSGPRSAGAGDPSETPAQPPATPAAVHEPVFEQVDRNRLIARGEVAVAPDHFNDLGVRKYDLPALLKRIRNHFRGPSASNPKLVKYLASGGVQGLRPLRYEKRVARNRFIMLVTFVFFILLGIVLAFKR
jgi:hypothetical protein